MAKVNKFLFEDLCIEIRLQINKSITNPVNPATQSFPQAQVAVIIGRQDQPFRININQPQILRVLKVVEQISVFNEFASKALHGIMSAKLSAEEQRTYLNQYLEWLEVYN